MKWPVAGWAYTARMPRSSVRSAAAARPSSPSPVRAAGEVRIIGGQWRRTRLNVPALPGLRPTPDRVRETLFNWLGQDLAGWRCLDAFAGTGALGLEAASRGAGPVWLMEQDARLAQALMQQVSRLGAADRVQVQQGDALVRMAQCPAESFDLVFLDPPFDGPWFEPSLRAALRLVPVGGWIYLEAPHAWSEDALSPLGLDIHRQLKAGAVHAHLLQRTA